MKLSEAGKLTRVHGGAVLASGTSNIGYADRRALNPDKKEAIAAACAANIPDNAAIFMNIGTTTEAVARQLLGHRGILVVTNNINVANTLVANPDCEIVVAGGQLRRTDGGLVGTLANNIVEQFKFDLAIIGCSAMDDDGDLLDFDMMEVGVSQTAVRRARKTFLVADHSKFARSAPARIASLADIDTFLPTELWSRTSQRDVQPGIPGSSSPDRPRAIRLSARDTKITVRRLQREQKPLPALLTQAAGVGRMP
nr:DeoR/GlpR family DNA-binding transcription regulator [Marinicella sp. W31]MDC2879905.1 DeoR/GlpR family DNA-binding transcription regulator [Marinicella sp. W31]